MSEQTYGELDEEEVYSFDERVRQEVNALQEKIHSLQAFLQTSQYADLPQNAKDLLQTQSSYMTRYAEILAKRLSLAEDRAE